MTTKNDLELAKEILALIESRYDETSTQNKVRGCLIAAVILVAVDDEAVRKLGVSLLKEELNLIAKDINEFYSIKEQQKTRNQNELLKQTSQRTN